MTKRDIYYLALCELIRRSEETTNKLIKDVNRTNKQKENNDKNIRLIKKMETDMDFIKTELDKM